MARLRIAVTGTAGQVAQSLRAQAAAFDVDVVAVGRPVLDLAAPHTIAPAIEAAGPDVLVSAAAYTDVNKAESEPELADRINGEAAGVLAGCAHKLGIPILHLSTDYVFDGTKPGPYVETDPINPQSAYGRSKAKGERAVAASTSRHVILRTCWVFSPFGRNFVKTMLALAARQPEVRVVGDQVGNPTAATDIAAAILAIAGNLSRGARPDHYGVFHLASEGTASWAEFATGVFTAAAERGAPAARVVPIATADYPTPAKRPQNSRLDCRKLFDAHGVRLPHWRAALGPCIDTILEPAA